MTDVKSITHRNEQIMQNKIKLIWLDWKNNIEVKEGHYEWLTITTEDDEVKKYVRKEWKPGHWQAHEVTEDGTAMHHKQMKEIESGIWLVNKDLFKYEEVDTVTKKDSIKVKHTKPEGIETAIRCFFKRGHSITREDIEDAFMDSVANAYDNREFKENKQIYGHTKTLQWRVGATNLGKNQRGETPKAGLRPYIGNYYSTEGENQIEMMGFDYKNDIVIGKK